MNIVTIAITLILLYVFRNLIRITYIWVLIPIYFFLYLFLILCDGRIPAAIGIEIGIGIMCGSIIVPLVAIIARFILEFRVKYYNNTVTGVLLFIMPPAVALLIFSRPTILNYLTASQAVTFKFYFFISVVIGAIFLSCVFLVQLFLDIREEEKLYAYYRAQSEARQKERQRQRAYQQSYQHNYQSHNHDSQQNTNDTKTKASSNASDFFNGVTNATEVKKRYRDLMKIFHPDVSAGDTETTKRINDEYNALLKKFAE